MTIDASRADRSGARKASTSTEADVQVPRWVYDAVIEIGRYRSSPPSAALDALRQYFEELQSLPVGTPGKRRRGPRPSARDGRLLDQVCERLLEHISARLLVATDPDEVSISAIIREVVGPDCSEADVKRLRRRLENEKQKAKCDALVEIPRVARAAQRMAKKRGLDRRPWDK